MHIVFMVLCPQFQTELGWVQAILRHSGPLSAGTDPPPCVFSNPASSSQALFSNLVKAVKYKTIFVQSSAAARSWKANLNLESEISKQWCLKIFIMEFYIVTFSFCCICKVGNYQLIIIDVMLEI